MSIEKIKLTQLNNWKKKDVPGDYWPADFTTSQLQTATFCVDYEGEVHRHKHKHEDNFWYIVSGSGWVKLDDEEIPVEAGDAIMIPKNTFHSARTDKNSRLRILQVECIAVTPPRKKSH